MPMDASKPLDFPKHEEYAQRVVALGNQSQAYRDVFKPADMSSRSVWVEACRMAGRLDVGRRIDYLRAQILERSQVSLVNMIHDLHDIATAEPGELMRMVVVNCKHCHGIDFKYQWTPDEFAAACETVEKGNALVKPEARLPLPTCEGGLDFDAHGQPHPMCPHCLGIGRREVWVADTANLSHKASKLYKGVKVKSDGSIEILMHDPLAARDQLHKLLGAYKTNADGQSLAPGVAPVGTDGKPAGDPSQTYLGMVHGGRKAG